MSPEILKDLTSFLKPEQIKTDNESIQYWGKDWTTYFDIKASAIVFPHSTEQVVALVKWARAHKMALIPSGGRTGLSGAAVATQGEVIVSFDQMNKILEFNEVEHSVLIQPGVVTESLQEFAKEKDLFIPLILQPADLHKWVEILLRMQVVLKLFATV